MIITCIAHAMFLIELDNGMRIVTDPVGESAGYKMKPVRTDGVLISHDHHDHADLSSVEGYTTVIRTEGIHTLAPDVTITAITAWHDSQHGAARGNTLLFMLEAEGLHVAHLGDLGHLPNEKQQRFISLADVLMLPVGGYYTIDAHQAKEVARMSGASVLLPMHYRTEANADWPIAKLDDFLAQYAVEEISVQPLLRVTADDLSEQKHVVVLTPQYHTNLN